jgi:hypothetical protein
MAQQKTNPKGGKNNKDNKKEEEKKQENKEEEKKEEDKQDDASNTEPKKDTEEKFPDDKMGSDPKQETKPAAPAAKSKRSESEAKETPVAGEPGTSKLPNDVFDTSSVTQVKPFLNQKSASSEGDEVAINPDLKRQTLSVNLTGTQSYVTKWTTGFKSYAGPIEFMNLEHHPIIRSYGTKIGAFSDELSFIVAKFDLIRKMQDSFTGILRGVTDTIEPTHQRARVTDESLIGYNFRSRMADLKTSDSAAVLRFLETLGTSDVLEKGFDQSNKLSKVYDFFALPQERDFYRDNAAIERRTMLGYPAVKDGVMMAKEFFSYQNGPFGHLKDFQPTLNLNFRYFTYILTPAMGNTAYDRLVSERPNNAFRSFAIDVIDSIVASVPQVPVQPTSETTNALLNALRIKSGEFTEKNVLTYSISSTSAQDFNEIFLSMGMISEFRRLDYSLDHNTFDLTTMIDCLTMKLCIPMHFFDVRTVNQIDNYLYRWMLPGINRARTSVVVHDQVSLANGSVNYLERAFELGMLPANARVALEPFMRTTTTGGGWLTAGSTGSVSINAIPHGGTFLNARRDGLLYQPVTGKIRERDEEPIQQFSNFLILLDYISYSQNWNLSRMSKGSEAAVIVMLRRIESRDFQFRQWATRMDDTVRRLNLCSLARPIRVADLEARNITGFREYKMLRKMSAYSSILLSDWSDLVRRTLPITHIQFGWAVREYLQQFTFWWHKVKEELDSQLITRSARLKLVMSLATTNTGVDKILMEKVSGSSNLVTLKVPKVENDFLDSKYEAATAFIDAMKNHLGYADEFYLDAMPSIVKNRYYAKEYVVRNTLPINVNEVQLKRHLRESTFTPLVRKALDPSENPAVIRFQMPVKLASADIVGVFSQPIPISYSSTSVTKDLVTKPVTVYRQKADEFYLKQANPLAFLDLPRFHVKANTEIRGDYAALMALFHFREVSFRKEFQEIDPTSWTFVAER